MSDSLEIPVRALPNPQSTCRLIQVIPVRPVKHNIIQSNRFQHLHLWGALADIFFQLIILPFLFHFQTSMFLHEIVFYLCFFLSNYTQEPWTFNWTQSVCRGQRAASSLHCQWWLYLIMLIMDHLCKDALSHAAKSTGEPQGEVKCIWFLRKPRNPWRQHSILLLETKELSLQLPTPPIIRPFPRLILTFAPWWAPHGTPTKTFLKSGQPFCHQEIKVQWRCFILLYVKKNTEYLNIF